MRKSEPRAPAVSSPEPGNSQRHRNPDQVLLIGVLLLLSALAWAATSRLSGGDMRIGILTGGGDDSISSMSSPMAGMALGLFMVTWLVMMVAMMFPSIGPVVLVFKRWASRRGRSRLATSAFVSGYMAVWGLIGLAYYGLLMALQNWAPAGPGALRVGGTLLLVAGIYQLTPLKYACLKQCRSPLGFVMKHGSRLGGGYRGPFAVGLGHGLYCLGCCWSLMIVLVLLGAMNLAWMGLVASLILAERVFPGGFLIRKFTGVALALLGVALVVLPQTLPALA